MLNGHRYRPAGAVPPQSCALNYELAVRKTLASESTGFVPLRAHESLAP